MRIGPIANCFAFTSASFFQAIFLYLFPFFSFDSLVLLFFQPCPFSPTAVNPKVCDSHPNSSIWLMHPCVRERQDPEHMAWSHRTSFTNKPLRNTRQSPLHGQLQPLGNRKVVFRQQNFLRRWRLISRFHYLCATWLLVNEKHGEVSKLKYVILKAIWYNWISHIFWSYKMFIPYDPWLTKIMLIAGLLSFFISCIL